MATAHNLEQPHPPFGRRESNSYNSTVGSRESMIEKGPHSMDAPQQNTSPFNAAGGSYVPGQAQRSAKKKRNMVLAGLGAGIVIIVAVVLLVYFLVVKPKSSSSSGSTTSNGSGSNTGTGSPGTTVNGKLITGGDGSLVTMEDGTTFTYTNKFGGYWYSDPENPFNNGARAQADVPPLNQTWKVGVDVIQGVNLGGWLVTEAFITPGLYQKYPGTLDEYTLSLAMRADVAGGGINQLEEHYKTFITEKDFAEIAGAGLNWIRLPIPYWAIETWDGEPFLEGVAWKYALKAFEWARKYGLRVNLDLHSAPGSQNPWWHSGRVSKPPNFLVGPMGYANAQRTLDYIRIITEFISQDQYKDVIPMFGILNEPLLSTLTRPEVERFYYQAHQVVRSVTGLGAGHGPYMSFHDGFGPQPDWAGFLAGGDRMALDHHPYFAFNGGSTDPLTAYITRACDSWGSATNTSMSAFGLSVSGEYSLAWNDCGLYINGVDGVTSYPGDCGPLDNWETWTQETKDNMRLFTLNQMSALQNAFFWTWKIGPNSAGLIRAPFWSYKLGLDNGWIPTNPRDAFGVCPSTNPFVASSFQPYQLGGAGAGTFTVSTAAYEVWPPANAEYLFAPNRPIPKLPSASFPNAPKVNVGDGWTNDADTLLVMGPNPGCTYPNPWNEGGGARTGECRPDGLVPIPLPVTAVTTGTAAPTTTTATTPGDDVPVTTAPGVPATTAPGAPATTAPPPATTAPVPEDPARK